MINHDIPPENNHINIEEGSILPSYLDPFYKHQYLILNSNILVTQFQTIVEGNRNRVFFKDEFDQEYSYLDTELSKFLSPVTNSDLHTDRSDVIKDWPEDLEYSNSVCAKENIYSNNDYLFKIFEKLKINQQNQIYLNILTFDIDLVKNFINLFDLSEFEIEEIKKMLRHKIIEKNLEVFNKEVSKMIDQYELHWNDEDKSIDWHSDVNN